jgi:hypothetical protein
MLSFRTNGNFIDFVNTDDTSLHVETVLMTLHNTSKCINWSLPEDTTKINFTIDEVEYSDILIADIDFDGVTMTAQADFKTNIETMFPGLAGGAAAGYLSYVALLSQTGTDAPVATVLVNTLGGTVVWTRDSAGFYIATLSGAFPLAKTYLLINQGATSNLNTIYNSEDGEPSNSIYLETAVAGTPTDGQLYYITVEIRVYP